jgi:hypothetical protein
MPRKWQQQLVLYDGVAYSGQSMLTSANCAAVNSQTEPLG